MLWILSGLVAPAAAGSWACDRDDDRTGEACAAYRETLLAWSRGDCDATVAATNHALSLADAWPASERRERITTLREAAAECWHAEWLQREVEKRPDAKDARDAAKVAAFDRLDHTGPDDVRGLELCTVIAGTRAPCEAFAVDTAPRSAFEAITTPPPPPEDTPAECREFVDRLKPMLHQPVDGARTAVSFQWIEGRLHERVLLEGGLSVDVSHGGCGHWSIVWDFYRVDEGDPRTLALDLLGRVKQDLKDGTVAEPWLRQYLKDPDSVGSDGTFACMEATTCWVQRKNGHLRIETDFAM